MDEMDEKKVTELEEHASWGDRIPQQEQTVSEEQVLQQDESTVPEEEVSQDDRILQQEQTVPDEQIPQQGQTVPDEQIPQQEMPYGKEPSYSAQVPEKKSGNPAVIIMVILFIILIGLCVFIAVSISKGVGSASKKDTEYKTKSDDPWGEILGKDKENNADDENDANEREEEQDDFSWGLLDPQDEDGQSGQQNTVIDWDDDTWKEEAYPNHSREEFNGPYYEDIVDCIDETVPYKVQREFYECAEKEQNVCLRTSYIQLDGNIPAAETINDYLKAQTMNYVQEYEDNKEEFLQTFGGTEDGFIVDTRSYVTYNDSEKISVAVEQKVKMGNYFSYVSLYGINVNLVTGTILDNASILSLNDGFGEEFRQRSNQQNGISEGGIEPYSNVEILSMLTDPDSLIIFYTPIGLELGYQYEGDRYSGWITISMQDYEKYLAGM